AMEDAQLTYGELESQSDQVASQLLSCGVGHERRAGFFFNRTPELLIGLIASLKANTVYVPLDPGHPAGRIAEIVAHAQLDLVVTSPELLSRAPNLGARVIAIGAEADSTRTDVPPTITLDHRDNAAVYMIYTSGSTGQPKGVVIERRGMVNHLWNKVHDLELTRAARVAFLASPSFDVSIWQMLAPLMFGAMVEVVEESVASDPLQILLTIERAGVTVLETVPSFMAAMVEACKTPEGAAVGLSTLDWLISNGE